MIFTCEGEAIDFPIDKLTVAGWTARDRAALQHHIDELAELGVAPPSSAPLYYRVSASLLAQADMIEALGPDTSGEAEPLILDGPGGRYIGLVSDHTDRALEATSVAHSKQIAGKIAATEVWRLDEIADLDALILQSWIWEEGGWKLYQDGTVAAILPLGQLIDGAGLGPGGALLCGTLGAIGGVRPAPRFRMRLADPATGREIVHEYAIHDLPVIA